MGKSSIEECIIAYCVKYNNLSNIISSAYANSEAEEINIIFDMYSVYNRILSNTEFFTINDEYAITKSIINLCAHYRAFFKYIGVRTNFHIVSSFNISEINQKLCKGYNSHMVEVVNTTINNEYLQNITKNIGILQLISDYLPNIYFHNTSFESGVIMEHIILNTEAPSIVLTKDPYLLQLVNLRSDCIVIRPYKPWSKRGEDFSYFINDDPVIFWNNYCKLRKIGRFDQLPPTIFANIVDGIAGAPWRHVRYSKSPFMTITMLVNLIMSGKISSSQIDVINILQSMEIDPTPDKVNTIKALDLNFQYEVYKNSTEFHNFCMKDLYDPKGIQLINEKYLGSELDLQRL